MDYTAECRVGRLVEARLLGLRSIDAVNQFWDALRKAFTVAGPSAVICADWRRLIANYRELLKLRFRLLNELESRPDFFYLVKTFQRENEELYNPESKKRNPSLGLFGFSAVEEKIPGVFQFLYICGFLIAAALTVLVVSGVAGQFMRLLNIPSLL